MNGDKEDGQQGAAVQTIFEPGQGDGGVPARTGEPYEGYSWGEVRIWSECSVLAEDSWSGAQWDTEKWLESWSHKCVVRTTCGRLLANVILLL